MESPDAIIKSHEPTHGDFATVGATAQTLKRILHRTPNWELLNPAQRESLEMDMTKTARILCGNPNEVDHWADKAGYATLGARACSHKDNQAIMEPARRLGEAAYTPNPPTKSAAVPFTLPTKKEELPKEPANAKI